MSLLIQIITTLALVFGIVIGEAISTKAFGTLKKVWLYLVEIAIFVITIVFIFNTIALTEHSDFAITLIYFFSGFLTIIFSRGIITGLGIFSEHIKKDILRQKDEIDYVIGLKKALERRGFKIKEIIRISKEIGFSNKNIEKVLVYFNIKKPATKKRKKKTRRKAY